MIKEKLLEEIKRRSLTNKNYHLLYKNFKLEIDEATSFLDDTYSISARVNAILLDVKELPVCLLCKSPTKFIDGNFKKFCSVACGNKIRQKPRTVKLPKVKKIIPPKVVKIKQVFKRFKSSKTNSFQFNSKKKSDYKTEMKSFIIEIYPEAIINYSNGQTLDVFIEKINVGIDFCSLYENSEKFKGRDYHIDKMNFFKEKGIQVINVFEDEWVHKKQIIKSMLRNKLGIVSKTIYARKCIVKSLTTEQKNLFLDENHLQGSVGSSINYGLFYEDELVAAMTFGKSRFNNYEWELIRLANKLSYKIIGGSAKLFKHFITNHIGTVISYCDLRYFDGGVYERIGMKFMHQSKPNYFYVKGLKKESRNKYQKHKLHAILPIFDDNLTEIENMTRNNFNRIFDCGNKVFVYDLSNV